VRIRDASQVCRGPFALLTSAEAPWRLRRRLGVDRRAALTLAGRAPIGAVPNWVTFTPDSRLLYISNAGARSVS